MLHAPRPEADRSTVFRRRRKSAARRSYVNNTSGREKHSLDAEQTAPALVGGECTKLNERTKMDERKGERPE